MPTKCEEFDRAVKEYMGKHRSITYGEAMRAVNSAQPTLHKRTA
jgi:hypothetical protein